MFVIAIIGQQGAGCLPFMATTTCRAVAGARRPASGSCSRGQTERIRSLPDPRHQDHPEAEVQPPEVVPTKKTSLGRQCVAAAARTTLFPSEGPRSELGGLRVLFEKPSLSTALDRNQALLREWGGRAENLRPRVARRSLVLRSIRRKVLKFENKEQEPQLRWMVEVAWLRDPPQLQTPW